MIKKQSWWSKLWTQIKGFFVGYTIIRTDGSGLFLRVEVNGETHDLSYDLPEYIEDRVKLQANVLKIVDTFLDSALQHVPAKVPEDSEKPAEEEKSEAGTPKGQNK